MKTRNKFSEYAFVFLKKMWYNDLDIDWNKIPII